MASLQSIGQSMCVAAFDGLLRLMVVRVAFILGARTGNAAAIAKGSLHKDIGGHPGPVVVCADQPKMAGQPGNQIDLLLLVRRDGDADPRRSQDSGISEVDGLEEIGCREIVDLRSIVYEA